MPSRKLFARSSCAYMCVFVITLEHNDGRNDCLINIVLLFLSQLKAFYVDLLVPLETNLEKDTKVVQVIVRS